MSEWVGHSPWERGWKTPQEASGHLWCINQQFREWKLNSFDGSICLQIFKDQKKNVSENIC